MEALVRHANASSIAPPLLLIGRPPRGIMVGPPSGEDANVEVLRECLRAALVSSQRARGVKRVPVLPHASRLESDVMKAARSSLTVTAETPAPITAAGMEQRVYRREEETTLAAASVSGKPYQITAGREPFPASGARRSVRAGSRPILCRRRPLSHSLPPREGLCPGVSRPMRQISLRIEQDDRTTRTRDIDGMAPDPAPAVRVSPLTVDPTVTVR